MRTKLADRDVTAAYRALQDFGVSQRQIARLTGQSLPEVSDVARGRRQSTTSGCWSASVTG